MSHPVSSILTAGREITPTRSAAVNHVSGNSSQLAAVGEIIQLQRESYPIRVNELDLLPPQVLDFLIAVTVSSTFDFVRRDYLANIRHVLFGQINIHRGQVLQNTLFIR